MFYILEISLIVILLILGSYEVLQLTNLGNRWSCFSRLSIKLYIPAKLSHRL